MAGAFLRRETVRRCVELPRPAWPNLPCALGNLLLPGRKRPYTALRPQMVMGGKTHEISPDEYIFASVQVGVYAAPVATFLHRSLPCHLCLPHTSGVPPRRGGERTAGSYARRAGWALCLRVAAELHCTLRHCTPACL